MELAAGLLAVQIFSINPIDDDLLLHAVDAADTTESFRCARLSGADGDAVDPSKRTR